MLRGWATEGSDSQYSTADEVCDAQQKEHAGFGASSGPIIAVACAR